MSNEPGSNMNLDLEMLAAYIDNRLTPEQRAEVEAQLAKDPDSYAILVETLRAQDELESRRLTAASKARRWIIAASVLTAVAALLLVVIQPAWLWPGRHPNVDPRFERLVAAVGDERYFDARLTGGFDFGPLRSTVRSSTDLANQNLALIAAAGDLQRRAQQDPSTQNLHAWGVAQLLLRDADGAIETLESALLNDPQSPALLSDLAAAYLTRFQWSTNAPDLPRAVDTAERARLLPGAPVELWFTRALAFEEMQLDDMAVAAWRDYLSKDDSSDWAAEARRRLDRLTSNKPVSRWESLRRDLLDVANLRSTESEIVREFPEEVPDLVFGAVLAAWAEATLSGDLGAAGLFLEKARRLISELVEVGGDGTLLPVIEELSHPRGAGQSSAFRSLGKGIQELDADRYLAADPLLIAAHQQFPNGSAARAWSAFYLARIQMFLGRSELALGLLEQAATDADALNHPQLIARALWMRGIIRFTSGNHDDARTDYERSIALNDQAREPRGAATALMNLSVVHRFRGDRERSWQHRLRGLSVMPRHRANRYYGFLTSTAISASLDDWPHAAVAIMDEAVLAADALAFNVKAESRLQRSRLLSRLGLDPQALADLQTAANHVGQITDVVSRTRTEASLKTASAEVLQESEPGSAASMAREAGEAFRLRGDGLRSAELALYESQSRSRLGDAAGALQALDLGIASFEKARAQIPTDDPAARISALEPAWALFDEDFARRVQNPDFDRRAAFRAFETSRARTVVETRTLTPIDWDEARRSLTPSEALLLMHQRDRELIVWMVTTTADQLFRLPWGRAESARLVALCKRETARAGRSPVSAEVLKAVLGDLVKSLPRGGTIIMVPDGAFQQMPWAGLRDSAGSPAVMQWAFSVAPSVSLALRTVPPARLDSVLVVGVSAVPGLPRLPNVAKEARQIADVYANAAMLMDAEATPNALLAGLHGAGVVHIAAHALDSPTHPMLSRLLLSDSGGGDGGLTTARILRDARASGAIVVLAACSSIGSASRRGEGTIGLAWAFLMADVSSVIGSLWALDDAESAALFVELHTRLASGEKPAAALRAAQLAAISRGVSGGNWAAMQVVGHP